MAQANMTGSASSVQSGFSVSDEGLRQCAEAIPGVAWVTAADGACEYVNSRGRDLGGVVCDRNAGHAWTYGVHPEDLEGCLRRWQRCVASGAPFEIELRYRRGDGAYRMSLLRALPLRNAEGHIVKWIGTETGAEAADDGSRAGASSLEQAIGILCHDLRTPLSAMIGWLHLIHSGKLDEAGMKRAIEKLHDNVKDQVRILDRMLDAPEGGAQ